MSRADQLNAIARRQVDSIGLASGMRYVADRMGILNMAAGWLEERGNEEPDVMDILSVAEFLAGDRVEQP